MATAKDLLRGRDLGRVFFVGPDAPVQDAIDLLAAHNVGALLVMDIQGKVVGILSERDIVRKVGLRGKSADEKKVSQIMTSKVLYVEASQTVEECMALMNEKGIRHLPVYENGALLGLISVRDVLHTIISEQKIFITHLEKYIRGG
ncbi:MAG: CBS domain-containing protein [Anaerolineales bacterium]|jgi:CBS domain-containing protein